MTRLYLAAVAACLFGCASSASGQKITGCYSVAGPNVAKSKDVKKLAADVACLSTVIDSATASRQARRDRLAVLATPTPVPTPAPTPKPVPTPEVQPPAPTPAPTPTGVVTSTAPTGVQWTFCAAEPGSCVLPYPTWLSYSAESKTVYRQFPAGEARCSLDAFGFDPAPGYGKRCNRAVEAAKEKPVAKAAGFQLGINVGVSNYWSGAPAFANLMIGDGWDLMGTSRTVEQVFDRLDNPTLLAGEQVRKMLTVPPAVLAGRTATIVCTWDGTARVSVGGAIGRTLERSSNRMVFEMKPWSKDNWGLLTWFVVEQGAPRNIDCRDQAVASDAVFAPEVIDSLRPFKVIRYLDWSNANGNPASVTWEGRTLAQSRAQGPTGVAIEIQLALVNRTGAAPWFTIPWNATEDYHRRMAQMVHDSLPADRSVYVEISNEVWNWQFGVTAQASKEGLERKLSTSQWDAVFLRYAEKIREVMPIWSAVFADRPGKLVRVAATQTGGPVDLILGTGKAADYVDAVAIAPYIGGNTMANTTTLPAALADLTADAALLDARISDQKRVVGAYNKRLIAYEGGQHLTGENVDLIRAVNRAPEMETIYRTYLDSWKRSVNDTFVHFNHVSPISRYGAWGLQEYIGQPLSEAPKRRAVEALAR